EAQRGVVFQGGGVPRRNPRSPPRRGSRRSRPGARVTPRLVALPPLLGAERFRRDKWSSPPRGVRRPRPRRPEREESGPRGVGGSRAASTTWLHPSPTCYGRWARNCSHHVHRSPSLIPARSRWVRIAARARYTWL